MSDPQELSSHSRKLQPLVTALFDRIIAHGFVQLVTEATRFMVGTEPSGLDHFYTNRPNYVSAPQVIFKGSSDHRLVICTRFTKSVVDKPRIIRKRIFKHFQPIKFIEELKRISWWPVYSCTDVDEAVRIFTEKVQSVLDSLAPVKTVQVRTNYAPWISKTTLEMMKERDTAQHRATTTKLDTDWAYYCQLRNQVTRVLKTVKSEWKYGS